MARIFQRLCSSLLAASLLVFSVAPLVSFAATVTDAYDLPSSIAISENSNHHFYLTLADAIAEGETLTITFPSDFDTSSIVEDDVDVEDDDVDLTTAADCTGSEQASVAMASDVLTMTICAGDGGAIASGSVVEVEIGTNAASSGSGANRITNPSSAGTYFVTIGGTFGGSGSIPIPIVSSSTGTVSATVPSTSSGSGTSPAADSVTVVDPNGGETVRTDEDYEISWTNSTSVDSVNLYYSLDNGSSYTLIDTSYPSRMGDYNWSPPNVYTEEALIKIEGLDSSGTVVATDTSDDVFTLDGDVYEIAITVPNGGEEVESGELYLIEWTSSNVTTVNLYYSEDGGSSYSSIVSGETDSGSYLWSVPEVETEMAYIKIEGLDSSGTVQATDASDAMFSIGEVRDSPVEEEDEEEEAEEDPATDDEDTTDSGEDGDTTEDTSAPDDSETDDSTTPTDSTVDPTDSTVTTPDPDTDTADEDRTAEIEVIVGEDQVVLRPVEGAVTVLSGTETEILVMVSDAEEIEAVSLTYGSLGYPLTLVEPGVYRASVPVGSASELLSVHVLYSDESTATTSYTLAPKAAGFVYAVIDGEEVAVEGAVVIVYSVIGGSRTQWDASLYGSENPVMTGADGTIGWYVPNGSYVVTAGRTGFEDAQRSIFVSDNILAPRIRMVREADVPVVVPTDPDVSDPVDAPAEPKETFFEELEQLREQPEVKTTARVSQGLAVASAVTSAAVLAGSFSLWPFLQYLVTSPILFFARRRRQNFGVVYNAVTKVPIDLAIVRLYTEAGKLVRTMVTDQEGRYFFKADPGRYRLEVVKKGLVFPSDYLQGKKDDGAFLDVYSGGVIEVTDKDVTIAANIPVDPSGEEKFHSPKTILLRRLLRVLQSLVAPLGILFALVVFIVFPNIFNGLLLLVQVLFFAVTLKIAKPAKRKGWGIVAEEGTQKALPNAVVRLFEPKYNKLIETAVTDRKGRYAFLAGPNAYYVTFEKPGFEKKEVKPIDYTDKQEPTPISVDIGLKRTA